MLLYSKFNPGKIINPNNNARKRPECPKTRVNITSVLFTQNNSQLQHANRNLFDKPPKVMGLHFESEKTLHSKQTKRNSSLYFEDGLVLRRLKLFKK
jgi:hypothetical protein